MEQVDLNQIVQYAPAVVVMAWVIVMLIRFIKEQQAQNNRLLSIIARCCEDHDDRQVITSLEEPM